MPEDPDRGDGASAWRPSPYIVLGGGGGRGGL